jgi:hypothetical protein
VVTLPVERGGRPRRLDARAVARELESLAARRRLAGLVRVREGCAGGCGGRGPNVSVAIYPPPVPGAPADHIAVGWRSYVGSIDALDCLATVIDQNLAPPADGPPRRRGGR